MYIGLFDVDYNKNKAPFPNLEMMKIAAYHKSQKDIVSLMTNARDYPQYSKIYIRKEKQDLKFPDGLIAEARNKIDMGGLGFTNGKYIPLPDEIEHSRPDEFLYKIKNNMPETYKRHYRAAQNASLIRLQTAKEPPRLYYDNTMIYDANPNQYPFFYDVVDRTLGKIILLGNSICDTLEEVEKITTNEKFHVTISKKVIYTGYLTNKDIITLSKQSRCLGFETRLFEQNYKTISFQDWCNLFSARIDRAKVILNARKIYFYEKEFDNSVIRNILNRLNGNHRNSGSMEHIKKYNIQLYKILTEWGRVKK